MQAAGVVVVVVVGVVVVVVVVVGASFGHLGSVVLQSPQLPSTVFPKKSTFVEHHGVE